MSLKDDVKSVLSELSPILAGFKLAVIVIGYFGFGSVAKWIISYWYPFTRWIWDQVAINLSLPEFPLVVKDSLTALIFFLPLGTAAFIQRIKGDQSNEAKHRLSSAIFGFLFLFLICKDVIASILNSISKSLESFNIEQNTYLGDMYTFIMSAYLVFVLLFFITKILAKRYSSDEYSFFRMFNKFELIIIRNIIEHKKIIFSVNVIIFVVVLLILSVLLIAKSEAEDAYSIIGAMTILIMIVVSLLLAIFYSPKKLFITTGAAVAFILAAVFFEGFILAKTFMESVGSG